MPKGHFNIKLLNSGNLTDEDFKIAQNNGTIDDLLSSLEVVEEYDHSNVLSHFVAGKIFNKIFGAPNMDVGVGIQNGNFFHFVGFGNSETEYDYTFAEYSVEMHNLFLTPLGDYANGDVKTIAAAIRTHKLTVEDDSTGLRATNDIHTWLWLPTHAISNEINEVKLASSDDQGATGWYYYDECRTHSRMRIKDANGVPQTISKTINQVLLVQWTLTMKVI